MPTNLYGPGDNFDLESSHVIPALMRKAHEAKVTGTPHLSVWGSGKPKREFLYVADLADAVIFLMEHYDGRSEEHTSELPSLMRMSYAVFCLKKKKLKK